MTLPEFSGKFYVNFISRRCCRVVCITQRDGVSHVFKNACSLSTPKVFPENLGAVGDEQGERFH